MSLCIYIFNLLLYWQKEQYKIVWSSVYIGSPTATGNHYSYLCDLAYLSAHDTSCSWIGTTVNKSHAKHVLPTLPWLYGQSITDNKDNTVLFVCCQHVSQFGYSFSSSKALLWSDWLMGCSSSMTLVCFLMYYASIYSMTLLWFVSCCDWICKHGIGVISTLIWWHL